MLGIDLYLDWLSATGHRIGDLRRLLRQYGRSLRAAPRRAGWFAWSGRGVDVHTISEIHMDDSAECEGRPKAARLDPVESLRYE